jgi:two-component system chemotaxis response regulator CheB
VGQLEGQFQGDSDERQEHAPIRVLIVDDSALMRRLLTDLLASSPDIVVVGIARDGREAVLQAVRLKPDVITLDVEMPEVSGLDALPALLAAHEAPVIMVSALTQVGADVTLQALELGAVDFMPKPQRNQLAEMRACRDLLISKILTAAQSRVRRSRRKQIIASPLSGDTSASTTVSAKLPIRRSSDLQSPGPSGIGSSLPTACIVVGISMGGPQALSQVVPLLSPPTPPIVVVQHMPAQFTGVFAERLNRYAKLTVREAEEGQALLPDHIFIAPGGQHLLVNGHSCRAYFSLSNEAPVSGHRPSIDVLFESAAHTFQSTTIGFLMTGMGRDGIRGCQAILAAGGFTLGQDESTSVVYGMNKAAFLEGAIRIQFALEEWPGIVQNINMIRAEFEHKTVK